MILGNCVLVPSVLQVNRSAILDLDSAGESFVTSFSAVFSRDAASMTIRIRRLVAEGRPLNFFFESS